VPAPHDAVALNERNVPTADIGVLVETTVTVGAAAPAVGTATSQIATPQSTLAAPATTEDMLRTDVTLSLVIPYPLVRRLLHM
jgi:hypothetical protein